MANINTLFPSKWLKSDDVKQGVNVQIAGMKLEEVEEGKPGKPVLYFNGAQKGLVLNKTNGQMIAHITGSLDTDDWVGKTVYLHSEPVSFQGRIVDSIRVGKAQAPIQAHANTNGIPPQNDRAAENAAQAVQFEDTFEPDTDIPF